MTIQEIEAACEASQTPEFPRHDIEAPELSLKKMFYPFGFPAEVSTNSAEVLEIMKDLWGKFEKQHDTEPILADVHVVEGSSTECPPAPTYRFMQPLLLGVAVAIILAFFLRETGPAARVLSSRVVQGVKA